MAEQIVELQPAESKQVSFEAIPHEARTYQVSVYGLTGSFRTVAPPTPAGILIWYSQIGGLPGYSGEGYATVWDINIYDFVAEEPVVGTPTGIKDLDIPMEFPSIAFREYLIRGLVQTFPGPANRSPYHLVLISQAGEYAWTPTGLLGAAEDRDLTNMQATITAQVLDIDYYDPDEGYDEISLKPLSVLSGDPAFAYIPRFHVDGNFPSGISVGDTVRCDARYAGPSSSKQFRIDNISLVPA